MSQLKELVTVEIPQDLKLKLFNSFINNSQSISLSEFNWIKGLNPELTGKMLEKLELSPLNNDNFISLVGVSVEHSNHVLLSKLIDLFSFPVFQKL
ncbi:hypothetical protein GEMRC1_013414 [Eukaryota sp. GEM-RC1]